MHKQSGLTVSRWARALGVSTAAIVATTLVHPMDARAEEAAQTGAPSTASVGSGSVDEIMVTARRREETLGNVPAAITAFSGEQLNERSIRTDSDLQLVTPGLTIRQTQGNNSLTYSIRGQTADTFSDSPTAVIAYLNDVPLDIGGASTFYDLENVQVLKGPQGTLFGRNATGGAVLFNSAKPTNEYEALLRGRVGNLDMWEVEGMANIPVVKDKVLVRAAFDIVNRDGYIDDLITGDKLGKIDRKSGRFSLTLKPVDRLENRTVLQYTRSKGTNTGASYTYSVYPCGATNNGFALTCSSGLLFGPGLDSVFGAGSWAAYLAAHPNAYAPGLVDYVNEQRRIGPYKTRHPAVANHEGEDWIITNTTTYEVNDNLRLKNIVGASKSDTDTQQPQLGAPFVTILTSNLSTGRVGNENVLKSVSEEFQIQGEGFDDKLTYIIGVYVQHHSTERLWPQTYFDLSPVSPPATVTNNFRIKNKSYAAYAQGTYDLSSLTGVDGLSFTGGVRYTIEKVSIAQLSAATYTFGAPDQSEKFEDPSWEVGLEYQVNPNLLTYVKTRGSFRSGGFNGSAPPINADATGGGNKFNSEHTKDVELGLKYNGELMGRPFTFNIDLYNQWITDVQRIEFPDPDGPGGLASIAVTANVPKSRVRGIEADLSIKPTDWLEIGGFGSYTDADFINGKITLFGNPFQYGPVGDTPKTSGVAYARVVLPLREDLGEISLRGEVYAQSEQYFSNSANSIAPGTRLPGYALLSGRVQWANIRGSGVTAAFFARNLTDKEYFTGGMPLAAALGHNAADVGEPRTFGFELSFRY